MKEEDIEYISPRSKYSISFVASFGYKVLYVNKKKNRMNDYYRLKNYDTGEIEGTTRKNFYNFINKRFNNKGCVTLRETIEEPDFNPCELEYHLFNKR